MQLNIIFCQCPLRSGNVEQEFEHEFGAATQAGFATLLVDHDAITGGDIERALHRIPVRPNQIAAIYRGWMMPFSRYREIYGALLNRGYVLVNTPDQFRRCHHLPAWYDTLQDVTPRSIWIDHLPPFDDGELADAVLRLDADAAIVKDFVKSEKQAWNEACFISNARDLQCVRRIVNAFIARRDNDFEGGLVLRQYQPLATCGVDERTGMPLAQEWRIFLIDGEPALFVRGFESAESTSRPEIENVRLWGSQIQSRFFTMDVARRTDGKWIVIELGDGQVAGLPESTDVELFYTLVARSFGKQT